MVILNGSFINWLMGCLLDKTIWMLNVLPNRYNLLSSSSLSTFPIPTKEYFIFWCKRSDINKPAIVFLFVFGKTCL